MNKFVKFLIISLLVIFILSCVWGIIVLVQSNWFVHASFITIGLFGVGILGLIYALCLGIVEIFKLK